jgi:hypothetical protein
MHNGTLFTQDFLREGILATSDWQEFTDAEFLSTKSALEKIFSPFVSGATHNEADTEERVIYPIFNALGWKDLTRYFSCSLHNSNRFAMTRRSSLRAQAREIYRALAAQVPSAAARENHPAPDLTEKVRALYEHSAVPVAEIAALAGVTERTIYKYARKGRWQARYAWVDRGGVSRRRWQAQDRGPDAAQDSGQESGKVFAPAKGAGGRFIRRADKGKPFAIGLLANLLATDPAGAERAAAGLGKAAALSREAQRQAKLKAEAVQRSEALIRAIACNNSALKNLREFHQGRDKDKPGPLDGRVGDVLVRIVEVALARVNALVAQEERAS